jgi:hypothetical protein
MTKSFAILAILFSASIATADINEIDDDQTIAVDCSKDKSVNLVGNNNTVTMTGTCLAVNISGNNCKVTGTAKQIKISGNENTLTLDATDSILVSGNDNRVTYKKAISKKKPGVLNSGDRNKIGQAK